MPAIAFAAGNNLATSTWSYDYAASRTKLGSEIRKEVKYRESDIVNFFLVRNNRLYKNDKWTKNTNTDDYRIWEIFASIAGDDFVDAHILRYATYKDPKEDVLAFVQLLQKNKEPEWGLAFNANASNFSNEKWVRDTAATLIHEYTHVLTLNKDQFDQKRTSAKSCTSRYLSSMGCAKKNAYLGAYVARFWSTADQKRKEKVATYYAKHPDDFITEYGVVDPEEDIAESFTQFVLAKKPEGTGKKYDKVRFFYEYPELVLERERIRKAIASYFQ